MEIDEGEESIPVEERSDKKNEIFTRKRKKSVKLLESKRFKSEDRGTGVCQAHKKAKKGSCQFCGVCRLCDPLSTCSSQGNHINWRRKLKKMCPTISKEENTAKRSTHVDDDSSDPQINPSTSKNKMTRIANILGLKNKTFLDDFPKKGFTPSSIDKKGRSFGRAKLAYKRMTNGIKNLICPSNPSLLDSMSSSKSDDCCKKSLGKVVSNLVRLSFFGNRNSRAFAQSLMASSFTRNVCAQYFKEEYESLDEDTKTKVSAKSRLMGSTKFTSLHKTFDSLIKGEDIPKQDYSSRIDSSRIAGAISFIQEKEPLKAGSICRDIQITGYLFKHVPVYGRSKKSIEVLQSEYCSSVTSENRIGRQTFREIILAMTRGNDGKNEVPSSYFLKFKHISAIFMKMLKRISELCPGLRLINELEVSWERIRRFLLWEYGNRHIQHTDLDALHCCIFALGETCQHAHADRSCSRCAECWSFFSFRVKEVLIDALEKVKPEERPEITIMIDEALPKMNEVLIHYMGYRLRTYHRFNAVNRIKNELVKADSGSKILIIIDHKEKIFPLKYNKPELLENPPEGDFRNKGICIIGTIEIQYCSTSNFTCRHIDYVFKDYYIQDNVQVAAVIENISRNILKRHPSVKEIIFHSDNASCFSEPELIPFIFNLNDALRDEEQPIIKQWVFTDVRSGFSELSSHFNLLNSTFKTYWGHEHVLSSEEDLLKALSIFEGLRGTTVLLLDASHLNGPIVNQKFKVRTIGPRETGEVIWSKDFVEVHGMFGSNKYENISSNHLYKHKNSLIITSVELQFATQDGFIPYVREDFEYSPSKEEGLANPKRSKYLNDLTGVKSPPTPPVAYPLAIHSGWANRKGETIPHFNKDVLSKLQELHVRSKDDRIKGKKITSEEALRILSETLLLGRWGQLVDLTIEDVKHFLQLSATKMTKIIDGDESILSADPNEKRDLNESDEFDEEYSESENEEEEEEEELL